MTIHSIGAPGERGALRDAAYWLSVEDYIMRVMQKADNVRYLLMWRVMPCVVFGKNQIAEAEIDLAEAVRQNVGVTRRFSGGGAVYLDPGAIQYAVFQPHAAGGGGDAMKAAREDVASSLADVLRGFGVAAEAAGRNDISAGGAKISGISQLVRGGWLNTHGTLLYNTDLNALSTLLKPDTEKFTSKAVQSVRRRVTNVKPLLPERHRSLAADAFAMLFEDAVREGAKAQGQPFADIILNSADYTAIEKIRTDIYANPEYTYRASPPYTYRSGRRFPQGRVEIFAEVKGGLVASCAIRGDFIGSSPVERLESALFGVPFNVAGFSVALDEATVTDCLGGISKEEFMSMVFQNDGVFPT